MPHEVLRYSHDCFQESLCGRGGGGEQIDCVLHAVVMTTWPAEPIGAPAGMQDARQAKRGHDTHVRAATQKPTNRRVL